MRFADDIALLTESNEDLQTLVTVVYTSSSDMGNIGKTEVQLISKKDIAMDIRINNTPLKQVEDFIYLRGNISQKGSCTDDVKYRIGKALGAMQNLNDIWKSRGISTSIKIQLYKTLILSLLMYGSETWTIKRKTKTDC